MKPSRSYACLLVAALIPVFPSCYREPIRRGGLMLVIDTNGLLELDRIDVKVETGDRVLIERSFRLGTEATLPASLGIVSNGEIKASVAVQVSGWRQKLPIDVRELMVQQVPTNRVAELRIVLSARCSKFVRAEGEKAESTCPKGQTCGDSEGDGKAEAECISSTIEASTLPDYEDGSGGSASDLGGAPNLSGGSPGQEEGGSGGGHAPSSGGKTNAGGTAAGAGQLNTGGMPSSGGRANGSGGDQGDGVGGVSALGGLSNLGSGGQADVPCSSSVPFCQGDAAYSCSDDGLTPKLEDTCESNESCFEGACEVRSCLPLANFCSAGELHQCEKNGLDHAPPLKTCGSTEYCDPVLVDCVPQTCSPGGESCANNVALRCNTEGSAFVSSVNCHASSQTCVTGSCVGECAPLQGRCSALQPQACGRSGLFENAGAACAGKATSNCSSASSTCVAREWALWPMPNPMSSGLPRPASYTLTSNVVVDNVTGLQWQRDFSSATFGVGSDDSKDYCSSLGAGGFSDWRLPSRIELLSLMDLPVGNRAAAIDSIAFPQTPSSDAFLTSSPLSSSGSYYTVFFNPPNVATETFNGRVRCVRDALGPPEAHYSIANGVVVDNWTHLNWQQAIGSSRVNYNTAENYCQNLSLSGGGWRMPSFNELNTLVRETGVTVIDPVAFPQTPIGPQDYFWSSSLDNPATSAYVIQFFEGQSKTATIETTQYLRCVR